MVIDLGHRVFGGKPQVFLLFQGIVEAGPGKIADGPVRVVDPLDDPGILEVHNGPADHLPVRSGDHQFRLGRALHPDFRVLVNVPVGVPGNGNGLFPGRDQRPDALHHNGLPEHRPVQNGPDGAVGAGPHLFQAIFLYPGRIGRNGGTFHRHPILFRCQG